MNKIEKELFKYQDIKYRDFNSSLIPNMPKEYFIGVRVPILRKLIKEIQIDDKFLNNLPHKYHEENLLHAFYIASQKDFENCLKLLKKFLPYVNSWAVSDTMVPKVFSKHKDELLKYLKVWVNSKDTYTIRFAIDMYMTFYLDDDFKKEYLEIVSKVKSDEYYVNMMRAWYFATALAKKWDETFNYIKEYKLDKWTHNKTIQKAIESYRIDKQKKELLRRYKISSEK